MNCSPFTFKCGSSLFQQIVKNSTSRRSWALTGSKDFLIVHPAGRSTLNILKLDHVIDLQYNKNDLNPIRQYFTQTEATKEGSSISNNIALSGTPLLEGSYSDRRFQRSTSSNTKDDVQKFASSEDKLNVSPVLSKKDQLKRAIKDYGSTVIVFHVFISLVSLGSFYVIVSR